MYIGDTISLKVIHSLCSIYAFITGWMTLRKYVFLYFSILNKCDNYNYILHLSGGIKNVLTD